MFCIMSHLAGRIEAQLLLRHIHYFMVFLLHFHFPHLFLRLPATSDSCILNNFTRFGHCMSTNCQHIWVNQSNVKNMSNLYVFFLPPTHTLFFEVQLFCLAIPPNNIMVTTLGKEISTIRMSYLPLAGALTWQSFQKCRLCSVLLLVECL